jgi:hypothetical protein
MTGRGSRRPRHAAVPALAVLLSLLAMGASGVAAAAPPREADAPPTISLFAAAPTHLAVGGSTELFVESAGGVPPLSFNYSGLPDGCTSVDAPTLTCDPQQAGNFTVTVVLSDSTGRNASARTWLTVTNVSHGSHGPTSLIPDVSELTDAKGISTVAFDVGAAVFLLIVELSVRRRRRRLEGEALARALRQRARGGPPSGR